MLQQERKIQLMCPAKIWRDLPSVWDAVKSLLLLVWHFLIQVMAGSWSSPEEIDRIASGAEASGETGDELSRVRRIDNPLR